MITGGKDGNNQIKLEIKQVDSFKHLGSCVTEDMLCTISTTNEAYNSKKNLPCGPLNKDLGRRLVKVLRLQCANIWSGNA